ncbi:hypothetical protein TNCV_3185311, partial [Trichonephila clavipes]
TCSACPLRSERMVVAPVLATVDLQKCGGVHDGGRVGTLPRSTDDPRGSVQSDRVATSAPTVAMHRFNATCTRFQTSGRHRETTQGERASGSWLEEP